MTSDYIKMRDVANILCQGGNCVCNLKYESQYFRKSFKFIPCITMKHQLYVVKRYLSREKRVKLFKKERALCLSFCFSTALNIISELIKN